jgi:hypothetical protein
MRIVAVEEHFACLDLLSRIDWATLDRNNGWPAPGTTHFKAINPPALVDTGEERIAAMETAGICMQVLSVPGPGAEIVSGPNGIAIARDYNDRMARLISAEPERFAAFAHLPMRSPSAAADELERAAYYDGLPEEASFMLAIAGWGWHAEVAVHILRLALSGAPDHHPRLKLLIGHMGEGLPAMMERVERVFSGYSSTHLERNAARAIVEQVWVSTSGFSSTPAFLAAFMTFGADRLLFSVDYPFGNNSAAVAFLENLPVSPEDREKIAHQNADALLRLMPRQ